MPVPKNVVDSYFDSISKGTELQSSDLLTLQNEGFAVIPGPIPSSKLAGLATAYDVALSQADPADVSASGATTRVHDFVNRGPAFDQLYVHSPVLEAACTVLGQPFKLSSFLARTLNPHKPSQRLHVDFAGDDNGWPMLGFIFMIDDFRPNNGATYFLPRSQGAKQPSGKENDLVQACGSAGSMIVYNGSVWHGHAANRSDTPRRSLQGAYIRRTEKSHSDFKARMQKETLDRLSPLAKYVLAL